MQCTVSGDWVSGCLPSEIDLPNWIDFLVKTANPELGFNLYGQDGRAIALSDLQVCDVKRLFPCNGPGEIEALLSEAKRQTYPKINNKTHLFDFLGKKNAGIPVQSPTG